MTTMKVDYVEGNLYAKGKKIAIIVSRFNEHITDRLLEGAIDCLDRHGPAELVRVFKVPGAFEIPSALNRLLKKHNVDGIICLGAVIRGETPHFEYVSSEVAKGIALISQQSDIPITFGVLTTDTVEQAINRAGAKSGNKGFESALSLIEMINIFKEM